MDFTIRDIIREARASINARLDMLELLIQNGKPSIPNNSVDLSPIEFMLSSLSSKMNSLENKMNDIINHKHEELPSIVLEEIEHKEEEKVIMKEEKKVIIKEEEEQEVVMEEEEEEEVVIEEEEEEVVEEEEEEEEEVVEVEEEVEEQELTEFEYKGMLLYRDRENKVYQMDEDGELVDTPIGVWNEAKQKVLRI